MSSKGIDFIQELLGSILGKISPAHQKYAALELKKAKVLAVIELLQKYNLWPLDEGSVTIADLTLQKTTEFIKELIRTIASVEWLATHSELTQLAAAIAKDYRKRVKATEETDDREIIASALAKQDEEGEVKDDI
jgi:hypothetical protein